MRKPNVGSVVFTKMLILSCFGFVILFFLQKRQVDVGNCAPFISRTVCFLLKYLWKEKNKYIYIYLGVSVSLLQKQQEQVNTLVFKELYMGFSELNYILGISLKRIFAVPEIYEEGWDFHVHLVPLSPAVFKSCQKSQSSHRLFKQAHMLGTLKDHGQCACSFFWLVLLIFIFN